ncbi:DUF2325 domain-containing protein [Methyloradius palustris]|uniref:DUF2325 domain-containing protein n=1 Tax=Methyloradius palustris TaxID=2778876 RepID=A0A8D5FZ45_9PROT|nr:DUF2325 domain-containing protein [Methyloradius palustris]BCM24395.1 hypothetical protein ZMTM_06540 [Methyloradius palustris]
MSTALIVGGDQIDGIKQELANFGIQHINHWSGRKVGDGKRIIPHDTELIVLITDWISHTFTHKIKQSAAKRGVRIVYTPNGPAALRSRLARIKQDTAQETDCRTNQNYSQENSGQQALRLAA